MVATDHELGADLIVIDARDGVQRFTVTELKSTESGIEYMGSAGVWCKEADVYDIETATTFLNAQCDAALAVVTATYLAKIGSLSDE